MVYPNTPGFVRGSPTSTTAAQSMQGLAPAMREQAHALLISHRPNGLTSDELEAITDWPHQTASARLRELVLADRAYVELLPNGKIRKRTTSHGRPAQVVQPIAEV